MARSCSLPANEFEKFEVPPLEYLTARVLYVLTTDADIELYVPIIVLSTIYTCTHYRNLYNLKIVLCNMGSSLLIDGKPPGGKQVLQWT